MGRRNSNRFVNPIHCWLALGMIAACVAVPDANARITEIDVATNTSAFSGATFGAGQYQMINGTVKGEVDPSDPLNAVIVDIALAPS